MVLTLLGISVVAAQGAVMKHKHPASVDDLRLAQRSPLYVIFCPACRGGGMADATDLKSVVRKDVRVRLPPSAPFHLLRFA
jgi:hypothetical protein